MNTKSIPNLCTCMHRSVPYLCILYTALSLQLTPKSHIRRCIIKNSPVYTPTTPNSLAILLMWLHNFPQACTFTVHTMRIKASGVVRTSTGQVSNFLADEALGVRVLPLRYLGPAILGRVSCRAAFETDSRS